MAPYDIPNWNRFAKDIIINNDRKVRKKVVGVRNFDTHWQHELMIPNAVANLVFNLNPFLLSVLIISL